MDERASCKMNYEEVKDYKKDYKPECKPDYKPDCKKTCKNANVKAETLTECPNWPVDCRKKIKVPVVLAEFDVEINTEAKIKLEEEAIEIKRIKKNVFITQCRLIAKTNKVFLEGYIRKNIEYATKGCVSCNGKCVAGDIKHTTCYIPFRCITKVNFKKQPDFMKNKPVREIEYLDCDCGCDQTKPNKREMDREHVLIFNEPVFCELEEARIFEADIQEDGKEISCKTREESFQCITEKMVICLRIKLLQKQQIPYKYDGYDC